MTVWDHQTLLKELESEAHGFFILTNSRALSPVEARELIQEISRCVKEAAAVVGAEPEIVLRGDSTLRGHFPLEPQTAEEVFGQADLWVLAPFFEQGGRLNINDVHYIANADELVPAAQTPFAKDASFGYIHSNLKDYVEEESEGAISAESVKSISLETIRTGGPTAVFEELMSLPRRSVVIVNAAVTEDMKVFVDGLLQARQGGRKFIYRTAAAFVSTRLAIKPIPPLSAADLKMNTCHSAPGGLIIAGSYVPKTTAQLDSLIKGRGDQLVKICLEAADLVEKPQAAHQLILDVANKASIDIAEGRDVLLYTSRTLIRGSDALSSLKIGGAIAEALVTFLRFLITRPRYIIAKGGITSSDAATKGLMMKRAKIRGQAAAGVPLWQCAESTSKYTNIPYVVFSGNVGQDDTLRDLVESWSIQST